MAEMVPSASPAPLNGDDDIRAVELRLGDRARGHRRAATAAYALVVVSLTVGGAGFAVAGRLDGLQSTELAGAVARQSTAASRCVDEIAGPSGAILSRIQPPIGGENAHDATMLLGTFAEVQTAGETYNEEMGRLIDEGASKEAMRARLQTFDDEYLKADQEFVRLSIGGLCASAKDSADELMVQLQDRSDPYGLATTLSVRVLIVTLLLFLTQILVTLQRYHSRMSAFYEARADALFLARLDPDRYDIGRVVALLSPDAIDFGRLPRSPYDRVAEVASVVASAGGPKKGE